MDTIAALATAQGKAGIAVIRVSGEKALEICSPIIKPKKKESELMNFPHAKSYYCDVTDGENEVDDAVVTVFRSPRSYTGEDTVEISCHGSRYITHKIMSLLISHGARLAEAGEYTKRAFLNGKITLTGAEAVGRLIDSSNKNAASLALAQTKGGLSRKISEIYEKISVLLSEIYVFIDYPDEDLSDVTTEQMLAALEEIKKDAEKLKNSYNIGRVINDGIVCTLIGKTNSGKSTFLNLLAGDEVAIVTDIAGTTRDIIESTINVGSYTLKVCDTAGIRETTDKIEEIGISRAYGKAEGSDLIIALFEANASSQFDADEEKILEYLENLKQNGKNILLVFSKSDEGIKRERSEKISEYFPQSEKIFISAKKDTSESEVTAREAFERAVTEIFQADERDISSGEILTEERQYFSLSTACDMLDNAVSALRAGFTQDTAGLDLERTLAALALCDSREVSEDITDRIFHNFCVGK